LIGTLKGITGVTETKAFLDLITCDIEIINLCKLIHDSSFSEFPTSVPVLDHNVVSNHMCFKVSDYVAVCYTNKWYPELVVSVTEGFHMITVRSLSNVGDNPFRLFWFSPLLLHGIINRVTNLYIPNLPNSPYPFDLFQRINPTHTRFS
jgi:hypothetical protein